MNIRFVLKNKVPNDLPGDLIRVKTILRRLPAQFMSLKLSACIWIGMLCNSANKKGAMNIVIAPFKSVTRQDFGLILL